MTLRRRARRLVNELFRDPIADLSGPALLDHRNAAATKVALRTHARMWRDAASKGPIDLSEAGLRVYSQTDDDGIILAIFAAIGTTNKTFVDIGATDGINSNCANLAVNLAWHGLMIDGNASAIERGAAWYSRHPDTWLYPPVMVHAMVTRDNINQLIQSAGFLGEIDFLSLDIDGNDYWVLEAIQVVQPRVLMVEINPNLGLAPVTIPYDPAFVHSPDQWSYFGASAEAFRRLAAKKGYRLVGSNIYGFNLFFVRHGVGESSLPEIPLSRTRQHPRISGAAASVAGPLVTVNP